MSDGTYDQIADLQKMANWPWTRDVDFVFRAELYRLLTTVAVNSFSPDYAMKISQALKVVMPEDVVGIKRVKAFAKAWADVITSLHGAVYDTYRQEADLEMPLEEVVLLGLHRLTLQDMAWRIETDGEGTLV